MVRLARLLRVFPGFGRRKSFARAKRTSSKTRWEIGRDYERYIGHLYEERGWRVAFDGATKGFHDMGRDLVARKGDTLHLVQCKRWARGKEIGETEVYKLFASMTQYTVSRGLLAPGRDILETLDRHRIKAVLVTTATLSAQARAACEALGVEYREEIPLARYPMIKCNVGADGSRIYHRPRDEFYDRICIEPEKGERYVWSARDAEAAGFRRAHRRRGTSGGSVVVPFPAPARNR